MPLRAQAKAGMILEAHRLDNPILGAAFHLDARGRFRDPLPMQRIHLGLGLAEDARELAAGEERDLVSRAIHLFVRHVSRRAMVHPPFGQVDMGVERAAQRDIQLLETAADAKHRHIALDRRADQRQRDGIAPGILRAVRPVGRAFVVMYRDIRRAAGEKDPVHLVQQGRRVQHRSQSGKGQRIGARPLNKGCQVFLADRMEILSVDLLHAHRNGHDRRVIGKLHVGSGPDPTKVLIGGY